MPGPGGGGGAARVLVEGERPGGRRRIIVRARPVALPQALVQLRVRHARHAVPAGLLHPQRVPRHLPIRAFPQSE